jgi:hypothetical protein
MDGLITVAASDLRPGDILYTDGVRGRQIVTPLDSKGRAMIDNRLIRPFHDAAYTVKREPFQVRWRDMEIWAVLNWPTMSHEDAVDKLFAQVDSIPQAAVEADNEQWQEWREDERHALIAVNAG